VRYGFAPLFITTTVLYLLAVGVMWRFFRNTESMPVAIATA
jgi:hypothetical protein